MKGINRVPFIITANKLFALEDIDLRCKYLFSVSVATFCVATKSLIGRINAALISFTRFNRSSGTLFRGCLRIVLDAIRVLIPDGLDKAFVKKRPHRIGMVTTAMISSLLSIVWSLWLG